VASTDLVRDQILGLITGGALQAGDTLPPERVLAREFGISRSSLREALRSLGEQGFLASRQGSGWIVRPASEAAIETVVLQLEVNAVSLERLVEARRTLEPTSAELAALRRTDADLEAIHVAFDAMRAQGADTAAINYDASFHDAIARATDNVFFTLAIRPIMLAIRRRRRASVPARYEQMVSEHRAIVDAIDAGDGPAARAAMSAHIDSLAADVAANEGRGGE
jgi:GntR family transcriptional repressor for pyruvate dehydrogenase complex